MRRLSLPQVTLVAIDTRTPQLAAESMQRSMARVAFDRALLLTQPGFVPQGVAGLEVVGIEALNSGADYSAFVLRQLPSFVHTSHVLVTQWDGFVLDERVWSDEFLGWDYVGAVWPDRAPPHDVGNGGFSLRSRRLLQAGTDARITEPHPEDTALCQTYRTLLEQEHGVRFAPAALARRFAFENSAPRGPTFGFHGPYNLPRHLDEPTLLRWLQLMPDAFFVGRDARRLARALLARRMTTAAQLLLQRRQAAGRRDLNTRMLGTAAAVMSRVRRG